MPTKNAPLRIPIVILKLIYQYEDESLKERTCFFSLSSSVIHQIGYLSIFHVEVNNRCSLLTRRWLWLRKRRKSGRSLTGGYRQVASTEFPMTHLLENTRVSTHNSSILNVICTLKPYEAF